MHTQDPNGRAQGPLYVRVAGTFETQIQNRSLKPGDKLPSVRELSRRLGISTATVVAAYGRRVH